MFSTGGLAIACFRGTIRHRFKQWDVAKRLLPIFCFYGAKGGESMAKSLDTWIFSLLDQFNQDELTKHVVRAKITIGLVDVRSGQIQYHTLEYTAKKQGEAVKERG